MSEIYLSSGTFNRRVVFEKQAASADSFGQKSYGPNAPQSAWSTVVTCWASVSPMRGQELRESGLEISELWTTIKVRFNAGKSITTAMRAREKVSGTIYDIRAIAHVEFSSQVIQLTCRTVK